MLAWERWLCLEQHLQFPVRVTDLGCCGLLTLSGNGGCLNIPSQWLSAFCWVKDSDIDSCLCRVVLDLARSAADESEARAWADDTAFLSWAEGGSGASIIAAELKVCSEPWDRALLGQAASSSAKQGARSPTPMSLSLS